MFNDIFEKNKVSNDNIDIENYFTPIFDNEEDEKCSILSNNIVPESSIYNNLFEKLANQNIDSIINSKVLNTKETKIYSKSNPFFTIKKPLPKIYLLEDIINIFKNKNINIDEKYQGELVLNCKTNNIFIENIKKQLVIKKRKKNKVRKINKLENVLIGRKRKSDETVRNHNKYSSDNIMNKIRNILKKYLVTFVNNVINKLYDRKQKKYILSLLNLGNKSSQLIKHIDYKSIANKIKCKENLELLSFTIKKFLSYNISTKYKNLKNTSNQFNKSVIEYLCNDNQNKDLFNLIFDQINFEDWLDIFIYKKNINDFSGFYSLNENKISIIESSLVRIDNLFSKIIGNEGNIFFTCFLLLIYNYKRFYLIKQGRKNTKIKKKSD